MKEAQQIFVHCQGQLPQEPKMVITIRDVQNPELVLQKAKEVMQCIAQYAYTDTWPDDEEWKDILPKWFVESMTSKSIEEIKRIKGQWHFESWLDVMYNRAWQWYSSAIKGNTITVVLELLNIPFNFEPILYIFFAQGIPMSHISDLDDIYGATQHG